jgi:hypothetical protein
VVACSDGTEVSGSSLEARRIQDSPAFRTHPVP